MKGVEDIIWMLSFAFVIIIVGSVLVIFYSNPVSALIDEATKLDAKYWSYQVSGVISLSESSDDGIETKVNLTKKDGKITISKIDVEVDFGGTSKYIHEITESSPMETKVSLMDYITDPENPSPVDKIEIDATKYKSII